MIQAYCSNCKEDLGVLPRPICSKNMVCRSCFTEKYLDSLFNDDAEMLIKLNQNGWRRNKKFSYMVGIRL